MRSRRVDDRPYRDTRNGLVIPTNGDEAHRPTSTGCFDAPEVAAMLRSALDPVQGILPDVKHNPGVYGEKRNQQTN